MELFPWSSSEELVHLLKSCPTGYPRAATALLRKLFLAQPALDLVLAELPVKGGRSLAWAVRG